VEVTEEQMLVEALRTATGNERTAANRNCTVSSKPRSDMLWPPGCEGSFNDFQQVNRLQLCAGSGRSG